MTRTRSFLVRSAEPILAVLFTRFVTFADVYALI